MIATVWRCGAVLLVIGALAGAGRARAAEEAAAAPVRVLKVDAPETSAVDEQFTITAQVRNDTAALVLANVRLVVTEPADLLAPEPEQIVFLQPESTTDVRWRMQRTGDGTISFSVGVNTLSEARPDPTPPAATIPATDRAALEQTWNGQWISERGYQFEARMELDVDRSGAVQGRIQWTWTKSPLPEDKPKLGSRGVEYVWGRYDAGSRLLRIEGYRRDDPKFVLGVDKYRLVLVDDGSTLAGPTENHGTWGALFVLRP